MDNSSTFDKRVEDRGDSTAGSFAHHSICKLTADVSTAESMSSGNEKDASVWPA